MDNSTEQLPNECPDSKKRLETILKALEDKWAARQPSENSEHLLRSMQAADRDELAAYRKQIFALNAKLKERTSAMKD